MQFKWHIQFDFFTPWSFLFSVRYPFCENSCPNLHHKTFPPIKPIEIISFFLNSTFCTLAKKLYAAFVVQLFPPFSYFLGHSPIQRLKAGHNISSIAECIKNYLFFNHICCPTPSGGKKSKGQIDLTSVSISHRRSDSPLICAPCHILKCAILSGCSLIETIRWHRNKRQRQMKS
jgi:hypothetical protein